MEALAKTFTSNIYAGKNTFNTYIGRKRWNTLRRENVKKEYAERVQALAAWILLDEFDPKIRNIIEEAVAERTDLFPNGWFGAVNKGTVLAFAHRLQPVKK